LVLTLRRQTPYSIAVTRATVPICDAVRRRPRYAAALRLPISETTTAYTHLALMLNENGEVEGLPLLVLNLDQREVSGLTKILKYVREHPDEFDGEDIEWTALFLESAIRIQLMPGVS
jgi:hypothetical protein